MNKKDKMTGLVAIMMAAMFVLVSCKKDDEGDSTTDLMLDVTGLPELDEFHVYEGWLIVDGSPVSTGTFTVDDMGTLSKSSFEVNTSNLDEATEFVISIEPSPDPNSDPSEIYIMAGSFIGNSANLSIEQDMAIGAGFNSAAGKYILATPTNDSDTHEQSGIWWFDPQSQTESLVLPELNDGWIYEGWVIFNGQPVSTGKFSDPSMADDSDQYSATLPAPDFPGEDFLTNEPTGLSFPVDMSGKDVYISVEPDPDNSPDTFPIKILTGTVPNPATDNELYDMSNNAEHIDIFGEVSF
ncbi:MAG: anti-sigma factor [Bacteroidota bacterium]